MEMTEEEICRSYRQAYSPSKQIKVLAELNCCKENEIKQILKDNGYMKKQGRPPEKPLSKAERLLKAVNDEREEAKEIMKPTIVTCPEAGAKCMTCADSNRCDENRVAKIEDIVKKPFIPEAVRIALENQIMALNKQINDLQAQRGEIEHFLGWDEVEKHLEERLV